MPGTLLGWLLSVVGFQDKQDVGTRCQGYKTTTKNTNCRICPDPRHPHSYERQSNKNSDHCQNEDPQGPELLALQNSQNSYKRQTSKNSDHCQNENPQGPELLVLHNSQNSYKRQSSKNSNHCQKKVSQGPEPPVLLQPGRSVPLWLIREQVLLTSCNRYIGTQRCDSLIRPTKIQKRAPLPKSRRTRLTHQQKLQSPRPQGGRLVGTVLQCPGWPSFLKSPTNPLNALTLLYFCTLFSALSPLCRTFHKVNKHIFTTIAVSLLLIRLPFLPNPVVLLCSTRE